MGSRFRPIDRRILRVEPYGKGFGGSLYFRCILWFFGAVPVKNVQDVRPKHVNLYLSYLVSKGLTSRTANSHLTALKSWGRYYEENYQIPSPAKYAKYLKAEPPKRRFLSDKEVGVLLKACRNKQHRDLILFLLNSGLRATEMENLRWADIDEALEWITVKGKGKKLRAVPINKILKSILTRYPRIEGRIQFTEVAGGSIKCLPAFARGVV